MKFLFVGIYDRGILEKERLHFRAMSDCDLQFCIIIDTYFINEKAIQAGQRITYWFAGKRIKAGENIVVCSRAGTESTENRPDGNTIHFYFRGNAISINNDPKSTAALFEIANWITLPATASLEPAKLEPGKLYPNYLDLMKPE